MLEGKVAIITGGTRGIGFETAKLFLENKAKVIIFGSKEESVNKALTNLKEFLENDKIFAIGGSFMMKGDIVANCKEINNIING